MKNGKLYIIIIGFLSLISSLSLSAQEIMVSGVVYDKYNMPIQGVNIIQDEKVFGGTDEDGAFMVLINPKLPIEFFMYGYDKVEVSYKGEQNIIIHLLKTVNTLEETLIIAKTIIKKITFEPTSIFQENNSLKIKTKFKIPTSKFKGDDRLIIQPYIVDVLLSDTVYMRPIICDGREYALYQSRIWDFNEDKSPLYYYKIKNTINKENNVIIYNDSVKISKNNSSNYLCDVVLSIEDFTEVNYRDTLVLAYAMLMPMRFFENAPLSPLCLDEEKYKPERDMNLFTNKGSIIVNFKVNKATIDKRDSFSKLQIEKIYKKLEDIKRDSLSTLKKISITGISSPEGNYNWNKELSQLRSEYVLSEITKKVSIDPQLVEIEASSYVSKWEDLVPELEKEGFKHILDFKNIIRENDNEHLIYKAVRKKTYYRSKEFKKALSNLRKVDYQIENTIFRTMTDDEVLEAYNNKEHLSRYQYYRLIRQTKDSTQRLNYTKEAYSKYPKFLLAANMIACAYIKDKDSTDLKILEKFIKSSSPQEILYNQTLMYLKSHDYNKAKENYNLLKKTGYEDKYLSAVISAYIGDYEKAYEYYKDKECVNKLVLLMAMNKDNEAYQLASVLMEKDNALSIYMLAACENRIDMIDAAMNSLEMAVKIDPRYKEIARLDADLVDIYKILYGKEETDK